MGSSALLDYSEAHSGLGQAQGPPNRRDPIRRAHAEASWVYAGGCELMWGGPRWPWLGSRRGNSGCLLLHPQLSGTQGSCSPSGQHCSRGCTGLTLQISVHINPQRARSCASAGLRNWFVQGSIWAKAFRVDSSLLVDVTPQQHPACLSESGGIRALQAHQAEKTESSGALHSQAYSHTCTACFLATSEVKWHPDKSGIPTQLFFYGSRRPEACVQS